MARSRDLIWTSKVRQIVGNDLIRDSAQRVVHKGVRQIILSSGPIFETYAFALQALSPPKIYAKPLI